MLALDAMSGHGRDRRRGPDDLASMDARPAWDDERDELVEPAEGIEDNLEEFLQDVTGQFAGSSTGVNVKPLEKSLEDQKRQLANMELQLREAKRQSEAESKMATVTKQNNTLETMTSLMSKAAAEETKNRILWESDWRERFSGFHGQHREMEEALKRKHLQELKTCQADIQRNIRRVATEIQRTKGRNMPSPRTLGQMQDDNMSRILILFHRHGQERLALASRVAKQEETLVKAKNKSLKNAMGSSQQMSTKLYKKVLPAVQAGSLPKLEGVMGEAESEAEHTVLHSKNDSLSRSSTRGAPRQRSGVKSRGAWMDSSATSSRSSRNAVPLPSPRIDYNTMTFLTGIEAENVGESGQNAWTRPSQGQGGSQRKDVARGEGEEALSYEVGFDTAQTTTGVSTGKGNKPAHIGQKSYFESQPDNAQFAQGVSEPSLYQGGGPPALVNASRSGMGPGPPPGQYMSNPQVGQEFGDWLPMEARSNDKVLPWNDGGMLHGIPQPDAMQPLGAETFSNMGQTWHPNIIAFNTSSGGGRGFQGRTGSKTLSPYLAARPPSKAPKGQAKTKFKKAPHGSVTSGSARSNRSGHKNSSTTGRSQTHSSGHGRMQDSKSDESSLPTAGTRNGRFPKIVQGNGGRQQLTDQNANRPYTDLGKSNSFAVPQSEKKVAIENWIENKIKAVLGESSGQNQILERMTAASSSSTVLPDRVMSTRAPTAASHASSDYAYSGQVGDGRGNSDDGFSEDNRGRSRRGDASLDASAGAVEGVFNKLKSAKGFGLEGRDDKMNRIRNDELRFKGNEVEQDRSFRQTEVDHHGKFARDGQRVPMMASQDGQGTLHGVSLDHRRERLENIEDRSKTPKRVGFTVDDHDGSELYGSQSMQIASLSELGDSRPITGVSSHFSDMASTRPGTSALSLGESGAGEDDAGDEPDRARQSVEMSSSDKQHFFSCVRHNKVSEVEDMLKRGFGNVETRDPHGNTLLMVAAQNGHKRLCKLALKFNADPNQSNHQGNTALHFANAYGYSALAKYLVNHDADDSLINAKGLTCYDGLG